MHHIRSVDSYILTGPWIPICWPVRGALHFWVIPLLRPVHGFLYFSRSRDPYILNSPWIPIVWTVHGSIYPAKLYHIKNYGLSRGTSFFRAILISGRFIVQTHRPWIHSNTGPRNSTYEKKSLSWFVQVGRNDDDSDDDDLMNWNKWDIWGESPSG